MSYTRFKGSFLSTDKINTVNYYICEPECDIRAIVQFAHGWLDSFDRNLDLIDFLTSHGIMVCGCDVVKYDFEKANKNKKSTWIYLVNDLKKLSSYMKKIYPDYPFYLYGHGLGSLVARIAVSGHKYYDGLILSGSSGRQQFCRRALMLSGLLKSLKGPDYMNSMIANFMQQKVNRRFRREKDPKAWTCSNPENRLINNLGAEGTIFYTMDALKDMFYMLAMVSKGSWYHTVPKDIPILLISGKDDPIGSYGKGMKEVFKNLRKEKCDVTMHIYDGMRHNIQDEPNHEIVFQDLLSWLKLYIDE